MFPIIKTEEMLNENAENQHLDGMFRMFLYFGILKNALLFVYVRIRTIFSYTLVTVMVKQPNIFS